MTLLWVCLFPGNNKHKVHCHHMKFDNSREGMSPFGSSFFPPTCVFLFLPIYPSILSLPSRSCWCKNKGKIWRLVTIRKVGALTTPLSFPLVFMLFVVCLFCCCHHEVCVVLQNEDERFMLTIVKRTLGKRKFSWLFLCTLVYLFMCLSTRMSPSPLFCN